MVGIIVFSVVFLGFFVLRAAAATLTYYLLLPDTARCPYCDEVTLRVESTWWNRLMPWFRTSWCYRCGWEGLLRPIADEAAITEIHAGQLPLSSKKSS